MKRETVHEALREFIQRGLKNYGMVPAEIDAAVRKWNEGGQAHGRTEEIVFDTIKAILADMAKKAAEG